MVTLDDHDLIALCQGLDKVEADLRLQEHRVAAIRMKLRRFVSEHRQHLCGFVEGQDVGIRPRVGA